MFFFPGLDSLIDRVPILNRVILGRNGNLVGAYFALTGQWGEPEASLIPIQIDRDGPGRASSPRGLPGFVLGGIKRIQSVILPSERRRAGPRSRDEPTRERGGPPREAALARGRGARGAAPRSGAASASCSPAAASTCCTSATCAASRRRAAWATGSWSA